ncbi:unnamed protein product [Linum tenue]|uniref:Uncharacterized protein n=1 Tax=Linum tenue TaxID=586396 RepID=A0AAV0M0R7_9ROSI|nr:unnamed protein product [Linum tenue]
MGDGLRGDTEEVQGEGVLEGAGDSVLEPQGFGGDAGAGEAEWGGAGEWLLQELGEAVHGGR